MQKPLRTHGLIVLVCFNKPKAHFDQRGKNQLLSKMVKMGTNGPKKGPKWSKTVQLAIRDSYGPFMTIVTL